MHFIKKSFACRYLVMLFFRYKLYYKSYLKFLHYYLYKEFTPNDEIFKLLFLFGQKKCIDYCSSYISGLEGYLLTLNSYYDEKDNSNPIKQYFDYHKSILYTNNVWKSIDVYIEPTEITFLNQTKTIKIKNPKSKIKNKK